MMKNTDHENVFHITFSNISSNIVLSAISNNKITGSCVSIGGDWHLGPLKNRNDQTYSTWFFEHFGYAPENLPIDAQVITINQAAQIFAWVNPSSSVEYANFIHWVSSRRMQEFSLISLPESVTNSVTGNVPNLSPLLDSAVKKRMRDIKYYIEEWNTLTNENSDFRLIDGTKRIRSFSSSYFNKYIINSVTADWEPSPEVVLRIMKKLDSENQAFPGDIFLYRQLEKFFSNGIIEKESNVNIEQTRIRVTSP
ncbi:DUF3658 domain-containing protein [Burkholderia cenocepacia]